jgi:hypothetical protein
MDQLTVALGTGLPFASVTLTTIPSKLIPLDPRQSAVNEQIICPLPLTTVMFAGVWADATPAQISRANIAAPIVSLDRFKKTSLVQ